MRPESTAFLWDVEQAARRIALFVDGVASESYAVDDLRKSAVERQLLTSCPHLTALSGGRSGSLPPLPTTAWRISLA